MILLAGVAIVVSALVIRGLGDFLLNKAGLNLRPGSSAVAFGFGLMTLSIGISGVAIITPPHLTQISIVFLLVTLLGLSFLQMWRSGLRPYFRVTVEDVVLIAAFAVALSADALILRFHASPDIYGMASAVGFFNSDFSYQFLQSEFMRYTGLSEPNWLGFEDPNAQLLPSPWNIPDSRVRFASDLVLGSGRLAPVLLLAVASKVFGAFAAFVHGIPVLVLFSAWVASFILVEIYREVRRLSGRESLGRFRIFEALIALCIILAPISILLLVEGALAQYMFFMAISYQLWLSLKLVSGDKQKFAPTLSDLTLYAIAPVFIGFTYGFGIVFAFPLVAIPIFFYLSRTRQNVQVVFLSVLKVCLSIVPGLLIAYFMNFYTFIPTLKAFLSGGTGAPYNPGYISLTSSIFSPRSAMQFMELTGAGGGFVPAVTEKSSAQFQLVATLILSVAAFTILLFRKREKANKLVLSYLVLFGISLGLSSLTLLYPATPTNTYFYIRSFQNFLFLGLPILLAVVFSTFKLGITFRKWGLTIFYVTAALLVVFQVSGALKLLNTATAVSQPVFPISWGEETKVDYSESLLISREVDQRTFALGLIGPNLYLTDNWNPTLVPEAFHDKTMQVLYLGSDPNCHLTNVGEIEVRDVMRGPIYLKDLEKFRGFSPNSEYLRILNSKTDSCF